ARPCHLRCRIEGDGGRDGRHGHVRYAVRWNADDVGRVRSAVRFGKGDLTAAQSLQDEEERQMAIAKNTICLWYDTDAEDAAHFYAETFPDSEVTGVHLAPSDYPSGKAGDVLT